MTMMIFVWTWIAWAVLLNVACFDVYDESNKLIRVENFYPPSGKGKIKKHIRERFILKYIPSRLSASSRLRAS